MLAHTEPERLKQLIREKIEKGVGESSRIYDAVLLGFGLCGNAVTGLTSTIPMVIPRTHDCCAIHMGSNERFIEEFGHNLSIRWCSTGYFERTRPKSSGYPLLEQFANYKTSAEYMGYVSQYDEETADYIWETLHPERESKESIYIHINGHEYSDSFEQYKSAMEMENINLRVVEGDITLMKSLIDGQWDERRFLTVPPGKKITGVYDMELVMKASD
jgi:hypothetical protein